MDGGREREEGYGGREEGYGGKGERERELEGMPGLSSHTHWECDTLISLPSHSHTRKWSFCNISHSFC